MTFARICEGLLLWLGVFTGLFFTAASSHGQALSTQPSANYLCQSWQSEEGLPYPIIRSILQTKDGYLVLGTQEGLIRFDGVEFRVFNDGTVNDRKNRSYVPLLETQDGGLWYSDHHTGLVRLKDGKVTHFGAQEGLTNGYVFSLCEDSHGNLWIGGESGLARWKDGKMETFQSQDDISFNFIRAIMEDSSGRILLGTPKGLREFKNGAVQFCAAPEIKPAAGASALTEDKKILIWSLLEDKAHNLWIGTTEGLLRWDGKELKRYTAAPTGNNTVRTLYQDRTGALWVGTYQGVYKMEGDQLLPIHFDLKLVNDWVYAITEDQEGDIWIGSNSGLNRIRKRRFQTYTKEDGLGQDSISSICGDGAGGIWIGTWGTGLSHLQNGAINNKTKVNGLASNVTMGLCQRRNGTLWVGTDSGLDIYQNNVARRYSVKSGLAEKTIKVVFEDSKGVMWLGGEESLTCYDTNGFKPQAPPGHATFDSINAIEEDAQGNIWIGSNNGLTRMKPGIYEHFTEKDGLNSRGVESIYFDHEGTLWIGTELGGLNWLRENRFYHCSIPEGLPCEEISQIVDDDLGYLWLGSRKGIFRVAKQQLYALGAKQTNSITPISFGRTDGLLSIQCSHFAQPGSFKDASGQLWFATARGAAVIDPKKLQINSRPPPVAIKQAKVDGKNFPVNSRPTFGPKTKEVEFFFTALSLQAASKVQFKVKLDNFDTEWKDNGNRRRCRYTGLRPGNYTFHVMACNNDNVWAEAPTTFTFSVAPKFYETKLFFTLCAVLIFGSGVLWNRLRVKRLKAREKELLAKVTERTEFAQQLQKEIQERKQAEAAVQESQKIILRQERLAAVGQLSAGVAHEFNNILTVILGHASLLNDQIHVPKINESISQISISAERAAQLTKQMLAFSRKQVMQPAAVQLNDIVRQEVKMLARVLEESIPLTQTLAPSLPVIWADPGMVEQVIMNLSLNARDAMPKGGKLEIQTDEMTIDSPDARRHPDAYSGHFVLLRVVDSGTGMDTETMQRIFEPFFTTKDVGKGTGLGLSTVYGIVKQHSGWIEVTSKIGQGTTFTVFLPVYDKTAKAKERLNGEAKE